MRRKNLQWTVDVLTFHTNSKDGIGLGLPISRKIIEQHSGSISLESRLGVGTVVILRLPLTHRYQVVPS